MSIDIIGLGKQALSRRQSLGVTIGGHGAVAGEARYGSAAVVRLVGKSSCRHLIPAHHHQKSP